MTEMNPLGTVARFKFKHKHVAQSDEQNFDNITKAGVALPGVEIKIVNSDDFTQQVQSRTSSSSSSSSPCLPASITNNRWLRVQLPEDGVASGELLVRGPSVTAEYYGNKAEDKFQDGWLLTGDVASIDPDGNMIIRDRSKDVIKSGGEWISSIDMENAVTAMPGVAMACVIAMPHPRWDERPVLMVTTLPNVTPPTLKEVHEHLLKGNWAKFQLPDDILAVAEIPMTSTGKMSKKDARQMLKQQNYLLPDLRKAAAKL